MAVAKDYLGTGIAFPFHVNANGGIALSSGAEHLAEGLRALLATRIGERVMRRDYGSRIHEVPFSPNDSATYALVKRFVIQSARTWEKRLYIDKVTLTAVQGEGSVEVRIGFIIIKNNREGNLVYPWYLHESTNV